MKRAPAFVELWPVASRRSSWGRACCVASWALIAAIWVAGCAANSMQTERSGTGGATGIGGQGPGTGDGGDWCRARGVFQDNCVECHGTRPLYGAPMSLVTFDDLHARSVTNPSKYVYEMIAQRIHDDQKPMPPPSTNDRLTSSEAGIVDAWIGAGAPASSDPSCSFTSGAGGATGAAGSADSTGSSGTTGSGGAGLGGAGGAGGSMPPVGAWPADCQQRYKLLAHGKSQPGDTTKFNVSGAPTKQFYQCFFFKVPYATDVVQALQFSPIIDDARVVHHWILYGSDTSNGTDGQVGGLGCSNGAFIAGWAPGGKPTNLPPEASVAPQAPITVSVSDAGAPAIFPGPRWRGEPFMGWRDIRTHGSAWHAGAAHGLQSRREAVHPVSGGFDSHALPPRRWAKTAEGSRTTSGMARMRRNVGLPPARRRKRAMRATHFGVNSCAARRSDAWR